MSAPGTVRWAELLRRYFGTKGAESVNVLSDVMPSINLLEEAAELKLYRDERLLRFSLANVAAGGAGTYARGRVSNPANSGRILVVTRFLFRKTVPGYIGIEALPEIAGAGCIIVAGDTRATLVAGATVPSAYRWTVDAPAVLPTADDVVPMNGAGALWTVHDPEPWVFGPGSSLAMFNSEPNETFDLAFQGYDVPLHGAE